MKSYLLAAALLLAPQLANSICLSCGCGSYQGTLWILDGNTLSGHPGDLFDYALMPDQTYFNFDGDDYIVPNSAMISFHVDENACTFSIAFDDSIAAGGFE